MVNRCQLNLRLDGRQDLLDTLKKVAAARGLSLNAWVVKTLEDACSFSSQSQHDTNLSVELMLDNMLDTKLDVLLESKLDKLLDKKLDKHYQGSIVTGTAGSAKNCDRDLSVPAAADLLNQLKGRNKKSKATLADVEAILELL